MYSGNSYGRTDLGSDTVFSPRTAFGNVAYSANGVPLNKQQFMQSGVGGFNPFGGGKLYSGPSGGAQVGGDDDEWLRQHMMQQPPVAPMPQTPFGVYGDFNRSVMPFGGQRQQVNQQPFNLFATMFGRR